MTSDWLERPTPLTLDDYSALDEHLRRELEVVDGVATPRERRDRAHQKTAFRLAEAFELSVAKFRQDHVAGDPPCVEVNTEVDVVLWHVPLTVRKPDVVVHHCLDSFETLEAVDVLIVVEVLSRWSESRDRIHKMGEYAKAGIPHYLIVQFDDIGATEVEHYALLAGERVYAKIGVTHRDRDVFALKATTPFAAEIDWQSLAIAPRN